MRTYISDLQSLRATIDNCINTDGIQRDRASDSKMQAYWQGKIDAAQGIREHLTAIIGNEIHKVYGKL